MVNEKRLIDANEYPCNTCDISYCYKNCDKFNAWLEKTVDAVEVVRCKDCKHYENKNINLLPHCTLCGITKFEDDFCSYGERRTDNG